MKIEHRVMFRMIEGECVALFPRYPGTHDANTCACYAIVGQHSTASAEPLGKPAKPEQYANLLKELQSIGYKPIRIVHRFSRADYLARAAAIRGD